VAVSAILLRLKRGEWTLAAFDSERDPSWIKRILWWVCLVLAPAVLLSIELFHPSGFTHLGMFQFLSHAEHDPQYWAIDYPGPRWWLMLHMIQTPLVGLVAVGLWLMVDGVGAKDGAPAMVAAWLARAAIFVMAVYFTVLDAIGGIGLGKTILVVEQLVADGKLTPQQVEGVALVLNTTWVDPLIGGIGSFVSLTASWAALAASVLIAVTLLAANRAGWLNMAVLVAFGWELQTAHASPHGPIAFALLIVASVWLWFGRKRAGRRTSGL
jgi:hypothetical protein